MDTKQELLDRIADLERQLADFDTDKKDSQNLVFDAITRNQISADEGLYFSSLSSCELVDIFSSADELKRHRGICSGA